MTKENFSELSTEDLIKKKKNTTFMAGVLAGVLIVLFISSISQAINEGFTYKIILSLGPLPILIISYNQIKSMKKELESRKPN